MPDFGELADEAKKLAGEHSDQVQEGLRKAGDLADEKTGGRFGDQIQDGEKQAENFLGDGGQN
ncbi:MAG: antitoxin [Streptosporangiaceae bacterium]